MPGNHVLYVSCVSVDSLDGVSVLSVVVLFLLKRFASHSVHLPHLNSAPRPSPVAPSRAKVPAIGTRSHAQSFFFLSGSALSVPRSNLNALESILYPMKTVPAATARCPTPHQNCLFLSDILVLSNR